MATDAFNKVNGTQNIYAVEILVSNLLMKTFLKVIRRLKWLFSKD
jgi:hypothetical protein